MTLEVCVIILQGKVGEAFELLRQLRQDVTRANNIYYNTGLETVEGYVYGCLTRSTASPLWLQTEICPPALFLPRAWLHYIVYGKALCLPKIISSSKYSLMNLPAISPSSTISSAFCIIRFSGSGEISSD